MFLSNGLLGLVLQLSFSDVALASLTCLVERLLGCDAGLPRSHPHYLSQTAA